MNNTIHWNALFFQLFALAGTYFVFGPIALGWTFYGFAIYDFIATMRN